MRKMHTPQYPKFKPPMAFRIPQNLSERSIMSLHNLFLRYASLAKAVTLGSSGCCKTGFADHHHNLAYQPAESGIKGFLIPVASTSAQFPKVNSEVQPPRARLFDQTRARAAQS